MTEIKMTGTQEFMNMVIPVIQGGFGENQKVVTDKTVGVIHNQPTREVRRRITDNLPRFKEYID